MVDCHTNRGVLRAQAHGTSAACSIAISGSPKQIFIQPLKSPGYGQVRIEHESSIDERGAVVESPTT